jgi:hypothetical protein
VAETPSGASRSRYEALEREAARWRELERLQRAPQRLSDAGAPGGGGPGGASNGRPAGPSLRGKPVWRGQGDGRFAGWAQGPGVALNPDERRVLADPQLDWMRPGRVFLGHPGGSSWWFVDSWYTIGPFPEGKQEYPPEQQVDLDAQYVGPSGAPLRWLFHQSAEPEIVPSTSKPYSVHYAYTKLRSDRERAVWLALGADDSMKVWLNGELVWDCGEHWRSWALDEGARRVTLRQGYNSLLVRLDNWPDHGAFSVAIRP